MARPEIVGKNSVAVPFAPDQAAVTLGRLRGFEIEASGIPQIVSAKCGSATCDFQKMCGADLGRDLGV
jgi:hypothetical protein